MYNQIKEEVADILAPENFTFTEEEKVEISNDFAKAIKPMIFEIFATNPNRAADLLLNMTDAFVYGTQTMYVAMMEKIKAAVAEVAKIEPPATDAPVVRGRIPEKDMKRVADILDDAVNEVLNGLNTVSVKLELSDNSAHECDCDNCKRRYTVFDGKSPIKVFKTEAEYLEYLNSKNK